MDPELIITTSGAEYRLGGIGMSPGQAGSAMIYSIFEFTIDEATTYSFSGHTSGNIENGYFYVFGSLFDATRNQNVYAFSHIIQNNGTYSHLIGDAVQIGSVTGILAPGSYWFNIGQSLRTGDTGQGGDTSNASEFTLNLGEATVPVPDHASTALLLSFSLVAIVAFRRNRSH